MDTSTVLEARPKGKAKLYKWNPASSVSDDANKAHAEWAPILEDAVAKLAAFETADDLAAFFKEQGIQGRTGDSTKCAAAVWLQKETGNPHARVAFTISIPHQQAAATTVVTAPPVVQEFYNIFDDGGYPELHVRGPRAQLL